MAYLRDMDWESLMAGYAVFCGQCCQPYDVRKIQSELDALIQRPEVLKMLLEAKARYRECFLGLVSPDVRSKIEQVFEREASFLNHVRRSLALSEERLASVGFFYDRICEWQLLCNTKHVPFLTKDMLLGRIEQGGVQNDSVLFKTIEETAPYYFLRRLQVFDVEAFSRIDKLRPLLEKRRSVLRVYEYGCGAADIGIYFARNGHQVTVSEVALGMLPLVRRRFELRNLDATYIAATAEDPIPDVEGEFDLIFAIEVLGHVRSPLLLLKRLDSSLDKTGFIVLGSFPFHDTNTVGDHLHEAVERRAESISWIRDHWKPLRKKGVSRTFIKKRRPSFWFMRLGAT